MKGVLPRLSGNRAPSFQSLSLPPQLTARSLKRLPKIRRRPKRKAAEKKEAEIKEVLILKNGDTLTGQLMNSTGTEIKFKTELAGEVTVEWQNVKELKSNREFAVVPKDVKNSRVSAMIPQGAIRIAEKDVVVTPTTQRKREASRSRQGRDASS